MQTAVKSPDPAKSRSSAKYSSSRRSSFTRIDIFPALRSDPAAVSGVFCQKQVPGNHNSAKKHILEKLFPGMIALCCLLMVSPLALADQSGDFTYTVSGGSAITHYTGDGGAVTIPAMLNTWPVVAIGNYAFSRNVSISSVIIPNDVTSIGAEAFSYCTNLADVRLPSGITSISNGLFLSCSRLKIVSIPASVASIGIGSFKECLGLKRITLPDNLKLIGEAAFGDCSGLTNVKIPDSVTSIGDYAFAFCGGLTSMTIPGRVVNIGNNAFFSCDSLNKVDFVGNAPTMGTDVFAYNGSGLVLYRSKSARGFKGAPWSGFNLGYNDPPLPWMSKEIGSGHLKGYTIYRTGKYTVVGSGAFGGATDKLRFSYQALRGDGEIFAKVKSLEDTTSDFSVGLMIRDTLAADSKQVFVGLGGSGTHRWVQRATTGGKSLTREKAGGAVANSWLRLSRKGILIQAYTSVNGVKWTLFKSVKIPLGEKCHIGLAVASGSDSKLNAFQFSNVKLMP